MLWLKTITKMKVLLKGVQCAEDAVMAYKAGLNGAVLSNRGGRQLGTCRPGIEVLPEVMEALKEAGCKPGEFSVFVDGGIRRGADISRRWTWAPRAAAWAARCSTPWPPAASTASCAWCTCCMTS